MLVHVLLFAGLRERAGRDRVSVEVEDGARVSDVIDALAAGPLGSALDELPVVMAVDREYATRDRVLRPDQELALIPPVSGGAGRADRTGRVHARVSEAALSLDRLVALVGDPRAGAIATFLGVTREVRCLEYEAYVEMAETVLREVAAVAAERHGLCAVAVEHRLGTVALGEASVAIAVSAPHRAEAFAGAREVIDELKARAPIWKREQGRWVAGAVPGPPAAPGTPPAAGPPAAPDTPPAAGPPR